MNGRERGAALYLVQARAGLPRTYDSIRDRCVLLSYESRTPETDIFLPASSWTVGRNALREHAMGLGRTYEYYVFLDQDIVFSRYTQRDGFAYFEYLATKLGQAIITPRHDIYNSVPSDIPGVPDSAQRKGLENLEYPAQTVDWFDAAMNAYRSDVFFSDLFPYVEKYDDASWWVSQFIMILRSNISYRNEIAQINTVTAENMEHGSSDDYVGGLDGFAEAYLEVLDEFGLDGIDLSGGDSIRLADGQDYPAPPRRRSKSAWLNSLRRPWRP